MMHQALIYTVAMLCIVAVVSAKDPAPIDVVLQYGSKSWDLVKNGVAQENDDCLVDPLYDISVVVSSESETPVPFVLYNISVLESQYPFYQLSVSDNVVSASNPVTIEINLMCYEIVSNPILLSFLFTDYSSVTATVPVMCYESGCDDQCDVHGTCIEPTGFCECDPPWQEASCASVLEMVEDTYCPGDPIRFKVAVANVVGEEWFTMFNGTNILQVFYWEYLSELPLAESIVVGKPYPEKGGTVTIEIPSLIPPGEVDLQLFADNNYTFLSGTSFTVLPYSDERCFGSEATCVVTGCKNDGVCDPKSGICQCDNARNYWFDCSRGCENYTYLTESNGTIDSGNYSTDTLCVWIVDPEGSFDYIHIEFERFQVTNGDKVKIMTVDKSGMPDFLIESFSGYSIHESRDYEDSKLAIVLETDYSSYGYGFQLNYGTYTYPSSLPITVIAVCCTIGAVIILVAVGFLIWREEHHGNGC